jgi:hypothetical protein
MLNQEDPNGEIVARRPSSPRNHPGSGNGETTRGPALDEVLDRGSALRPRSNEPVPVLATRTAGVKRGRPEKGHVRIPEPAAGATRRAVRGQVSLCPRSRHLRIRSSPHDPP